MSLKNLKLPKAIVEVPGSEEGFAVRGISFQDIGVLLHQHKDLLENLYSRFTAEDQNSGTKDVAAILKELLATAPALCATIIVLACGDDADDTEANKIALRLPAPVQLDALEKTMQLTFAREGGVKKMLETVTRAMAALNNDLPKL